MNQSIRKNNVSGTDTGREIEIKTIKYPNFREKSFIKYIKESFETLEKDANKVIYLLKLHDCFYEDKRIDCETRRANYGNWNGFIRFAPHDIRMIKEGIEYLENSWDEIIKDVGIEHLILDNKWLSNEIKQLTDELSQIKKQLSTVLL